jgi:hypothetical protein
VTRKALSDTRKAFTAEDAEEKRKAITSVPRLKATRYREEATTVRIQLPAKRKALTAEDAEGAEENRKPKASQD